MSPMSAEATVVRNYLDWMTDLPWSDKTKNKIGFKLSSKDTRRRSLWFRQS